MSSRALAHLPMWQRLFRRFAGRSTLQRQLREMLVHAMYEGLLAPGAPVPSSRVLATALKVSRTTVTLVLQDLSDSGLLVAKPRSGYFVSPDLHDTHPCLDPNLSLDTACEPPAWSGRIKLRPSMQRNIAKPRDWLQQPYPFIYGQFDPSLFPVADWRSCVLESLHVRAISSWAPDHIDGDSDLLVEQIQQRLLPARGIWVKREEILITAGAQHAMFLLAHLLVDQKTTVGIENPGYPDARNNFALRTEHVKSLPLDHQGLIINQDLADCQYVYVTPSHQCPTTITMPLARRQQLLMCAIQEDVVIIEDDYESELNFLGKPTPALKSLDTCDRVIYLGSLSKIMAHGLRVGYIVASAELIHELRALRRLMLRHPATNNEHAAGLFIAHGYHESFVRRLNGVYQDRAREVSAALHRHIPGVQFTQAQGGSALWVEFPSFVDTRALAHKALQSGIVIEPGDVFFSDEQPPAHFARLGYSSIPLDRIDAGIARLAEWVFEAS